ncbi:hypothetical protein IWZ01DRAFT_551316 [Phyllosticta capitalensis]
MTSSSSPRIKALLFDIGGVVVLSPLAAITAYEQSLNLPPGYINSAIAAAAPNGAFQRLERGEMQLDDGFFRDFERDVRNRGVWERVVKRERERERKGGKSKDTKEGNGAEYGGFDEAMEKIDAKALFWTMMRAARHPDPHIFPALQALVALGRARSSSPSPSEKSRAFVVGALSNAVVFPAGVRDERGDVFDAGVVLGRPESGATASDSGSGGGEGGASAAIPPLFDTFLHSAHIGLRKPDPRIYTYALHHLSAVARERGVVGANERLQPQEVLFLDDIGANLKVARECGLRTCKVEIGRTEEAVRVLEGAVGVGRGALGGGEGRGARL